MSFMIVNTSEKLIREPLYCWECGKVMDRIAISKAGDQYYFCCLKNDNLDRVYEIRLKPCMTEDYRFPEGTTAIKK